MRQFKLNDCILSEYYICYLCQILCAAIRKHMTKNFSYILSNNLRDIFFRLKYATKSIKLSVNILFILYGILNYQLYIRTFKATYSFVIFQPDTRTLYTTKSCFCLSLRLLISHIFRRNVFQSKIMF